MLCLDFGRATNETTFFEILGRLKSRAGTEIRFSSVQHVEKGAYLSLGHLNNTSFSVAYYVEVG